MQPPRTAKPGRPQPLPSAAVLPSSQAAKLRVFCLAVLGSALGFAPVSGQQLPDPASGVGASAATVYTDEAIGDVDPRGVSTRWIDPAQAGDLMRDRVVRTRALTPSEAAAAGLNPRLGATRGYAYRAPGVRATFHRPAYVTLTFDGPRVNGRPFRPGDFTEIIPADTVFDMTPEPSAPAELTGFSASMLVDGRLDLSPDRPRATASPAAIAEARASRTRTLQPWVRVETDENGRSRLVEREPVEASGPEG